MSSCLRALLVLSLLAALPGSATAADSGPGNDGKSFSGRREFHLGGPGGWDYLAVDPARSRLFITRADRVMVMSTADGSQVGTLPDTAGVHGVALAPSLGLGFTSNGRADTVTVFDLASLASRAVIPVGAHNPDAILFEPATQQVFTFNGRSHDLSILDPLQGRLVKVLPVGGKPEFAVADGRGTVFVNIEDTGELLVVDARQALIRERWPLPGCKDPTGLAIDASHRRLFSVCGNAVMAITDADTGRQLATLPIGAGADAAGFDDERSLAFSSNGQSGTLTVVREDDPGHFRVVDSVTTPRSARTMAVNPLTHRVYLVAADFGPVAESAGNQPRPRPPVLEGSFVVIELIP